MAAIIRLKRSTTSGDPTTLGNGELAYSSLAGLQNNGGDRIFIGVGTETAGNAAAHHVIGGKYFTDMLDHVHGTVTADSALIVDSASKLDILNVDNVTLNGNTVSTTDTNGNLILNPNGTGKVSIASAYTIPRTDGTINQYLQTNGSGVATWQTIAASSSSLSIAGDTGTDVVTVGTDTFQFTGGTGITSVVTNNTVTFDIDSTVTTLTGSQVLTNKTLTTPAFTGATVAVSATLTAGTNAQAQGAITTDYVVVTTTAANPSGVTLPTATVGSKVIVVNKGTNPINIYPATGGFIDAISINTSIQLAVGSVMEFNASSTTQWYSTSNLASAFSALTGTLGPTQGGTGLATYTTGDLLYASGTNTLAKLAVGSNTNVLTLAGGVPTWAAPATAGTVTSVGFTGGLISVATATSTPALTVAGTSGGIPYFSSGTTWATSAALVANALVIGGGAGVAPSTVTTGANVVTALGVAVGSAGAFVVNGGALGTPSSGTLTNCTFPTLDQNTSGTAAGLSATLVVGSGGTGTITGSITGTGALTFTSAAGNNNVNLVPTGSGSVDVASKKITNLADPTAAQDAATKNYVDGLSQGLKIHPPCDVATTGTLTSLTSGGTVTYDNGTLGVGATLTLQNSLATLDTITLTNGMRVLVKNQANQAHNGIYTWATGGTVLTRAIDADQIAELTGGDFSFVVNGSQFGDCGFVQTEVVATMGTTSIIYTQFSGAGAYTAGAGLTQTGTTFDVIGTTNRITVAADSVDISTSYVGQTSITTLGTIGTGTWNGGIIGGTYGGTGVNNGAATITLAGSLTFAGSFTQSFTATANTAVTLPTTGTLATLAGAEALSNKTITLSSFSGTTIAASGLVTLTNATDATNLTTAAVVLSGGLAVTKAMYVGTNITGAGAATSTLDGFNIDGGTY